MTDLLVKLYTLPPLAAEIDGQTAQGIVVRRAIAPERHHVTRWVREQFSEYWVSECEAAFSRQPPTVWLATEAGALIGFACHDATMRGFFGPTGVAEAARGRGTGRALLVAALHDMAAHGYAYAIIGGVGPIAFYQRTVGAIVIDDSTPGAYAGMLRA
jgi:GNAT superfamily N-acetyltransferase